MIDAATAGRDSAEGWESLLRREARSSADEITPATEAAFVGALVDEFRAADASDVIARIRYTAHGVDDELSGRWQYDRLRALVIGGCIWWQILGDEPTAEEYAAYATAAKLSATRAATVNPNRRTFRHAWAGYHYLRRIPGKLPATIGRGFNVGSRELRDEFQDAVVALVLTMLTGEDIEAYWNVERQQFTLGMSAPPEHSSELYQAVEALRRKGTALAASQLRRPARSFQEQGADLKLYWGVTRMTTRFVGVVYADSTVAAIRKLVEGASEVGYSPLERWRLWKVARMYRLDKRGSVRQLMGYLALIPDQLEQWDARADPTLTGSRTRAPSPIPEAGTAFEEWRTLSDRLGSLNRELGRSWDDDLRSLPFRVLLQLLAARPHDQLTDTSIPIASAEPPP